ncbi:MAG: protein tolB [Desulfovibrio sp.]
MSCTATLLVLLLVQGAFAAQTVNVDIFGPGQRQVNVFIAQPQALNGTVITNIADTFEQAMVQNLSLLPFLKLVDQSSLLGGNPAKGVTAKDIDFKPLNLAKVDIILTTGWENNAIQLRAYSTFSGSRIIGKAYGNIDDSNVMRVADRFCSLFMKALTGKMGFFESTLAFVSKVGDGKQIFTVRPQGRDLKQITSLSGFNISPAWSMDGSKIVFTHIGATGHELGLWEKTTNKTRLRRFAGDTVIGPAFSPENELVVTLAKTGSPDIYKLNSAYKPTIPLVHSWAIDVSASFDRTGKYMAFVSGRMGNPHIFLLDRETGKVKRVTYEGKYNTNPCLSPDGRYIAFSRMMPGGHRIFMHDLLTGMEKQITFGPGADEDPAFGPDGYFVAFSSNRSGQYKIYLTTRHGDAAKMVNTDGLSATAPAWDTANRQN